jgi:hypothetical protein
MAAGLLAAEAPGATGCAISPAALTDLDLAIARQAVAAEILAIAFYTQALASKQLGNGELKYLKRAQFNEQEHLKAVSDVLTAAGQTPSTSDDFTITFPKNSFTTAGSIAKLGVTLETGFVGAYLGAVDGVSDAGLKTTAADRASESQHLSVFSDSPPTVPSGLVPGTARLRNGVRLPRRLPRLNHAQAGLHGTSKPPAHWGSASTRFGAGTVRAGSRPRAMQGNRRQVSAREIERLRGAGGTAGLSAQPVRGRDPGSAGRGPDRTGRDSGDGTDPGGRDCDPRLNRGARAAPGESASAV